MSQLTRKKERVFFFFLGADCDVPSKRKCQVVFMFYLKCFIPVITSIKRTTTVQ